MAKSKKNHIPKTAITGRLGVEAAMSFMRHNGAGVMLSDKRCTNRGKAKRQAINESE